ncbi:hypothetical protein Sm713_27990 [Streptomyces sp. TS71-3]|nr:hypothetical protein Sm713_27990 [Streptomyces sp. TS71-3]
MTARQARRPAGLVPITERTRAGAGSRRLRDHTSPRGTHSIRPPQELSGSAPRPGTPATCRDGLRTLRHLGCSPAGAGMPAATHGPVNAMERKHQIAHTSA